MKTAIQIFLFIVVVATGCNRNAAYQQNHYFTGDKWQRFDFVRFNVPVIAGDSLNMDLTLVHTKQFRHKQIRLNVTIYKPDGEYRSRNITLHIKDNKKGWLSQPADSGYLKKKVSIAKALHFTANDTCVVRIEHKVPFYEMEGIHKLVLNTTKVR